MSERPPQFRMAPRGKASETVFRDHDRPWTGDLYARLLATSWPALGLAIGLVYLLANLLFATLYFSIEDSIENTPTGNFVDMFFFSVQTMATIGYGKMTPNGLAANLLVTIEALFGFAFFALVTGLVYTKFSRPTARVLFSDVAVIMPYQGAPHLMLRLANERGNRIADATVHLVALLNERTEEGHEMRRFHDMALIRSRAPLIRLTWTVMHRIDEHSPLHGLTMNDLIAREAEIIVSLTGLDETLSQTIHARFSYLPEDLRMNAAFVDILRRDSGNLHIDFEHFHMTCDLHD